MSENIKKCDDGTYRWVYEFDMLKNPIILLTVLKIFLIVLVGIWVMFGLFRIGNDGFVGAFALQTKELLIPAAILLGLSIVAYIILACIYGWKYCVLFEMNETGIRHIQMEKQYKKAQAIGWLTVMAGAAAGKPGAAGTGLLAATKNEQATEFSKVKRMRALKAFHTIKLDGLLNHNQIYAEPEDYEFVLDYISKRIPKSKSDN
ncbi:hypothetical protein [Bifidobacterium pseudolongum]|uniref:hypothetical protein n=1 Tax=Bifidobacterium pseudolongum TaxID=1694 RepID=UPI00101F67C6|nr:hypothetical protein [Bifidobacterium pseudolongum]RYQ27390.1 hypothetical protein PG2019B_1593 [Bifidobacterium pseudolongum subsp. globosum]